MKTVIPISEARQKLPSIIRFLRESPDAVFQVTVHNEVVAEIRCPASVEPGAAAARLLEMRKKLRPPRKGYKTATSEDVKKHLYVSEPGS